MSDEAKARITRATGMTELHYQKLASAHKLREIMKVEADVGKLYYPTFALAFKPEFEFQSRNSRRTYRPSDASDVFNALLNYGFSILYAEVAEQPNTLGLDCYVGFYHTNHTSRLPWVYDMIEPFRHLVDRSVFEIQESITKDDFIYSTDGLVVLSGELKQKYIELLTSILDRKLDYKARIGIRRPDGYQQMEEATIIKMKCAELRDFLTIG